jgi:hypothetical protein
MRSDKIALVFPPVSRMCGVPSFGWGSCHALPPLSLLSISSFLLLHCLAIAQSLGVDQKLWRALSTLLFIRPCALFCSPLASLALSLLRQLSFFAAVLSV